MRVMTVRVRALHWAQQQQQQMPWAEWNMRMTELLLMYYSAAASHYRTGSYSSVTKAAGCCVFV